MWVICSPKCPFSMWREADRESSNPKRLICRNTIKINRYWLTGRHRLRSDGSNAPPLPIVTLPTSSPSTKTSLPVSWQGNGVRVKYAHVTLSTDSRFTTLPRREDTPSAPPHTCHDFCDPSSETGHTLDYIEGKYWSPSLFSPPPL